MAGYSVIHTYLCGHFDSNPMPGATAPQYVFVDSGCSNFECSHTDNSWFKEQGTSPSARDMSLLAKQSRQLTFLQHAANSYAKGLSNADPYKLQRIADVGFPNLLDLSFSDDPHAHSDATFHLSTIKNLLRYARQFAKNSKTKAFFDFCMGELSYFLRDAEAANGQMVDGFKAFGLMTSNPERLADFCQWPGARSYHEPSFGEKELAALRTAGVAGKEILRQLLNASTLHIADLTIRTLDQQTPVAAACPRPTVKLTIPCKAGLPKPTLDLEGWLAQEEKAFVAELKRATAKKARQPARNSRIQRIGCVGTDVNRVFKCYLPTLARCA